MFAILHMLWGFFNYSCDDERSKTQEEKTQENKPNGDQERRVFAEVGI